MWENQLSWLVAMFPPVQAMMLPNDAVNGLWIVTGDANWNSEAPIRLDHTSKPDPKLIENDRRERTEASTWTWRRTICASSGDPAQQSGSGFRPAWPWRRMETVKQQPDGEFKNVESVGDDTLTVTDSARDGAGRTLLRNGGQPSCTSVPVAILKVVIQTSSCRPLRIFTMLALLRLDGSTTIFCTPTDRRASAEWMSLVRTSA
ncbi:hypothetical protein BKA67DRAFT_557648 [Truncatella angustata]|uniref:Secreted protein n=1 Tax=Truncatella angustata TaxID=152316 RepID=A0A9P8UTY6_9PEZI|nr:uncharacterized protein BKA67DRAFT_557648 [Truncatella angustata]KAH6658303.1 hypothetical protein BKA67DRAFT_557648 [Truncatella angustata]